VSWGMREVAALARGKMAGSGGWEREGWCLVSMISA